MVCGPRELRCVEKRIIKGDDHTFRLLVQDKEENVVDITGATISFTAKASAKDLIGIISKSSTVAGEIDIINAVGGIAEINLVPADTEDLELGIYIFDVELIDSNAKKYTIVTGFLEVVLEITY